MAELTWPFMITGLTAFAALIGWWSAMLWRENPMKMQRTSHSNPIEEWIMRRPMEFGPILQSREQIDRIRDAIVEDQLGARKESPKQRRQRMARYRGWTDRQRVQHWLLHWREDYMAALTGREWAFE